MPEAQLHRLLAWTSPAYPTGAFSYSHGLEWAVESGAVRDAGGLTAYVDAVMRRGGGWVDAVLFAHAWEAAGEPAQLDAIAELGAAFRGSAETALESHQQGRAFLQITRRAWPHPWLEAFAERQGTHPVAHAVVMALACAAHGVALVAALNAYLHALAANLVSAGVRLVPLGQTDGQIATATLSADIGAIAEAALATGLDELGTAAPGLELCAMHHETQYTRLFRS
ncbi:urease accessory protein UreF [Algiphilus aromaticivorans]|uniref:urease accessory protein UreF n=1 Tax=Algiphilus aromaticivorans TaxID=382454 RepID=UPI0005C15A9E|nr:urease accessory protein UreF [Algiphilus aromaticivorans]